MSFTSEPIYAAVFAFWQALTVDGVPLFKTATRKAKLWVTDTDPSECPMLLQMQMNQVAQTYRKGIPPVWRCEIRLYLYVHTGASADSSVVPSMLLNPLIDAIRDALRPDNGVEPVCTLGGLVSHCAIEGAIDIYEGDLADDAIAIIPVFFLVSP